MIIICTKESDRGLRCKVHGHMRDDVLAEMKMGKNLLPSKVRSSEYERVWSVGNGADLLSMGRHLEAICRKVL